MGDSIVFAFKLAAVVAASTIFLGVITALVGVVISTEWIIPPVFREVVGLISIYLPFNAGLVFGLLIVCLNAVIAFLVGRKIYQLTNNVWKNS